jgi:hypothetical protein
MARATAVLEAGLDQLRATGVAHKNPADTYVVDVARQVASARALDGLSRQLLVIASTRPNEWDTDVTPLER